MEALSKEAVSVRHDYLSKLHKDDPEEFERQTRAMLEEEILKASPHMQLRLRALQARTDVELSHYKHPVARMNRMVELFWNKAFELRDALNGLLSGQVPEQISKQMRKPKERDAKIIPLFKKQ